MNLAANAAPSDLTPYAAGQATAISASGDVFGWSHVAHGSWRAFHQKSSGEALPLDVTENETDPAAQPLAASTDGGGSTTVVGWSLDASGFHAWRNKDDAAKVLASRIDGASTTGAAATGVNARGEVVGWYLDADGFCRAFHQDGSSSPEPLDWLEFDRPEGGVSLMLATAIGDDGSIVGQTRDGEAFLLRPVP